MVRKGMLTVNTVNKCPTYSLQLIQLLREKTVTVMLHSPTHIFAWELTWARLHSQVELPLISASIQVLYTSLCNKSLKGTPDDSASTCSTCTKMTNLWPPPHYTSPPPHWHRSHCYAGLKQPWTSLQVDGLKHLQVNPPWSADKSLFSFLRCTAPSAH